MTPARLRQAVSATRHLGLTWSVRRALYTLATASGRLERQMPVSSWADHRIEDLLSKADNGGPTPCVDGLLTEARFVFSPQDLGSVRSRMAQWPTAEDDLRQRIGGWREGIVQLFGGRLYDVGCPPKWHQDPETNHQYPPNRHWSRIPDFGSTDIKRVWELNRFRLAFDVVRWYWRTGDEEAAELFWQIFESWRQNNPPNQGVNWKCGQEVAVRAIAWCFALHGLRFSPSTTPDRVRLLAECLAFSAQRIESNIAYAVNQRNNHGLSEAAGLYSIGVLLPCLPASTRWRNRGKALLESQILSLFADDGSFSQHSTNYHRVALQVCLWSLQIARLNEDEFCQPAVERLRLASNWLAGIADNVSGYMPRIGQQDGSLVLPLTECSHSDLRPVLQSASVILDGRRRFTAGPWDEEALWLAGASALEAPLSHASAADFCSPQGGFSVIRSHHGMCIARCGSFRFRPSQADLHHVDLWWRGLNVALDPGTYSYNAPEPWNNPLAGSAHHNTVTVDGLDQMDRVGRFLWLPWPRASSRGVLRSTTGHLAIWQGTHDAYRRRRSGPLHRRSIVLLGGERWLVVDRLIGSRPHRYRLQWLLADTTMAYEKSSGSLVLHFDGGDFHIRIAASADPVEFALVRADDGSPRGWEASAYDHRKPALSLSAEIEDRQVTFVSYLGSEPARAEINEEKLVVHGIGWSSDLSLGSDDGMALVKKVVLKGPQEDRLECTAC